MKPRVLLPLLVLAYALAFFFFQACNPETSGSKTGIDSTGTDTAAMTITSPLGEPEKELMDISGGGEGKYIQGEFTIEKAMEVVYGLYDKKMECSKWVCLPNEKSTFKNVLGPDGHVYTKPTKVLDFTSGGYKHKFLITESPGRNEGGWESCHACAPVMGISLFAEIDGDWFVQAFRRDLGIFGAFGELPEPSLVRLGNDNFGIALNPRFTNQGVTMGSTILFGFSNDRMEKIFDQDSYFSNEGIYFAGYFPERAYEWEGKIRFQPGKNPHYDDLVFMLTGKRPADSENPESPVGPYSKELTFTFNGKEYVADPGQLE